MNLVHIAFYFFSTIAASFIATWLILVILRKLEIFDIPNKRSSHTIPTPRGGGIAIILVLLLAVSITLSDTLPSYALLVSGILFLSIISWLDDLRGLSASIRLVSQIIATTTVITLLPSENPYFHNLLPFWLDSFFAVVIWIWFINLFNFMDGIDGITTVETISIGFGLFLLMLIGLIPDTNGIFGLLIAAVSLGFLWWNWHPAKIFLGDVGSIPLGFILGWLLLQILPGPNWEIAIILPLYYLADATITIIQRGYQGKKIWEAHREHFYQLATEKGFKQNKVSLIIAVTNTMLIGWSMLSLYMPTVAILCACINVISTLFYLRGAR